MKIIIYLIRFIILYGIYYLFNKINYHKNLDNIIVSIIYGYGIVFNNSNLFYLIFIIILIFLFRYLIDHNRKIDNKISILINRGIIDFLVLNEEDISIKDVIRELKKNKINSIENVDLAIINRGKIIIFSFNKDKYPIPIVVDGNINRNCLIQINKDEKWLNRVVVDEGYRLEDINYCFYKDEEIYLIKNK